MRITASCHKSIDVGVNVALVYATIFTSANNENICKEQAKQIASEVVEQYSYNYTNISNTSIELGRVRCVDSNGVMSIEHKCVFEIHQSGEDLLGSLSTLEWVCIEMCDNIRIDGWEVSPGKDTLKTAIEQLVTEVYKDTEYEANCLLSATGSSDFTISDVIVKDYESDIINDYTVLPDQSSTERDMMFELISQLVPLSRRVGREVTVVLDC